MVSLLNIDMNSLDADCAVIFVIQPIFADKIFVFEKKYEFRKVKCRRNAWRAFIYESRSARCLVGEFEISNVYEGSLQEIWNLTKNYSGVSLSFYESYYKSANKAIAYEIRNPIRYIKPIPLKDIGLLNIPQSFMYISNEHILKIDNLIEQTGRA